MSSLGNLPDEVLLSILEQILDLTRIEDVIYLLKLQRTCRSLFHFIQSCPQLQVALYFQARHCLSTTTLYKRYRGFPPLLSHHFAPLLQPAIAAPEAQRNPRVREFCPFYACYWARNETSRANFLHRDASWRRLLLTNDVVIETLEIYRCIRAVRNGTSRQIEIARVDLRPTISQQSDFFSGGLTMGFLYDLLASSVLSGHELPPIHDWGIHIHQKVVEGKEFTPFSEFQPPMEQKIGNAILAVVGHQSSGPIEPLPTERQEGLVLFGRNREWWQPVALDLLELPKLEWRPFLYST